ncbi:hypothetical protein [Pseudophaeobacter leonis]|uniref:hypothetical protein n=1 Tax=Pseudophaeobacter leonis TaxID=1144477 RepID=UPI0009F47B65|nr:hypothetical protein [Pseudophaeobacter leonis]
MATLGGIHEALLSAWNEQTKVSDANAWLPNRGASNRKNFISDPAIIPSGKTHIGASFFDIHMTNEDAWENEKKHTTPTKHKYHDFFAHQRKT